MTTGNMTPESLCGFLREFEFRQLDVVTSFAGVDPLCYLSRIIPDFSNVKRQIRGPSSVTSLSDGNRLDRIVYPDVSFQRHDAHRVSEGNMALIGSCVTRDVDSMVSQIAELVKSESPRVFAFDLKLKPGPLKMYEDLQSHFEEALPLYKNLAVLPYNLSNMGCPCHGQQFILLAALSTTSTVSTFAGTVLLEVFIKLKKLVGTSNLFDRLLSAKDPLVKFYSMATQDTNAEVLPESGLLVPIGVRFHLH